MEPPSLNHLFGTDLLGNDILIQCLKSLLLQVFTLIPILIIIFFGGAVLGSFLNDRSKKFSGNILQGFLRYWVSLPVLLIAIFFLVLTSPGQLNVILILSFFLMPSQAIYVMNQLSETRKLNFLTVKVSQGFSKLYLYKNHLIPFIKKNYLTFTLSRIPEIVMIDLALNFFGLGVQPPLPSFGRLLYDGIGFMLSGWWLWVFPSFILILINLAAFKLHNYAK